MRIVIPLVLIGFLFGGVITPAYAAFSTDGHNLVEIDLTTGDSALVGPHNTLLGALAVAPSGQLFGLDIARDELVLVDAATGQAETIGALGFDVSGSDLTFDGCGRLWLLADIENHGISLALVDQESGNATILHSAYEQLHGIADLDGKLITVSTGEATNPAVYEIVPQSGQLIPITDLQQVSVEFWAFLDSDANGDLVALSQGPWIVPPPPTAIFWIDLDDGSFTSSFSPGLGPLSALATDSSAKVCRRQVIEIPTLEHVALIALTMALAAVGLFFIRRTVG